MHPALPLAKSVFCTIITENYYPFANALYDSLSALNGDCELIVLLSDKTRAESTIKKETSDRKIRILHYDSICQEGQGKATFDKYHKLHHDAFRWAMKPVLLLTLLTEYEKVVYVDCDIHFYHDYSFLYALLDDWSVLLSPHFRSIDPSKDYDNYIMQFNNGIFNGGFIGARRDAVAPLSWWAKVCGEICEVNPCEGQFVDQSHLNLLPVYFDKVHVLQHRGCNVANWNQLECKRVVVDGSVRINGEYPVVFVHFTKSTVRGIMAGSDQLLRPLLEIYLGRLKQYSVDVSWILPSRDRLPLHKKLTPAYFARFLRSKLRGIGMYCFMPFTVLLG